ncbi:MAG: terpene cyclase/mutase family protein [Phycisphaerales bacterium]|nr:MAG: terpene cyclase/mutase family protein [Phycisphaerales bacterium]
MSRLLTKAIWRAGPALLLLSVAAPSSSVCAEPAQSPAEDTVSMITPRTVMSVQRGLDWLASKQESDGSYGRTSNYGRHVGLTGLAGLAFLSDGSAPGRGKYGRQLDGCVSFILDCSGESGLLAAETSHGPMYGHGFATLFLAEIYGMTSDPRIDEALHKAVRLIVYTQNDQGGWRYQPVRADADISVTVCEVMALRAARNVGIYVPKSTIDAAIAYVKLSQNDDGGFRYMLTSGSSAFARSAAGVATLQYAGIYRDETIDRALRYLEQFRPGGDTERNVGHYFYGHYYAAQAMFQAGEQYWRDWYPAIRDELLESQEPEGYWRGQAGTEYGTAMALIILQMPNRLLPIFQK